MYLNFKKPPVRDCREEARVVRHASWSPWRWSVAIASWFQFIYYN